MRNYLLICIVLLAGARQWRRRSRWGWWIRAQRGIDLYLIRRRRMDWRFAPPSGREPRQMTVDTQPALTVDAAGGRKLDLQVAPWFTRLP